MDDNRWMIEDAVRPSVKQYKIHTEIVKRWIEDHGVKLDTQKDWDFAGYNVLNTLNGRAPPSALLNSLNLAIRGRRDVNAHFTEYAPTSTTRYDQRDVAHRVFVDRLRTFRRIWFPHTAREATPEATALSTEMATVSATVASKLARLKANNWRVTRSTVSQPVTLNPTETTVPESLKKSLTSTVNRGVTNQITNNESKPLLTGLFAKVAAATKSVTTATLNAAASIAGVGSKDAAVPESFRGPASVPKTSNEGSLRIEIDLTDPTPEPTTFSRASTPRLKRKRAVEVVVPTREPQMNPFGGSRSTKRRRASPDDQTYIEISSDSEDSDCDSLVEDCDTLCASPRRTRSDLCRDVLRDRSYLRVDDDLQAPIRRSTRLGHSWVFNLSVEDGRITSWKDQIPTIHLDAEDGRNLMRRLLGQRQNVTTTVLWEGSKRELTYGAMMAFAVFDGDAFSDLLPDSMEQELRRPNDDME